jgi:Domain of unknown function (DUF1848)
MIISASRRTDIAAFYTPWFMNRLRAGFCTVPNPMNRRQISRISLEPVDVDAFVFWTRDPRPMLEHLPELDRRDYRYYFQFTLLGYPRAIDPKAPAVERSLETFRLLADRVGPERVIWRYDPIFFSELTPPVYHVEQYGRLATALTGFTRRSVVSVADWYGKLKPRFAALAGTPAQWQNPAKEEIDQLLAHMGAIAGTSGMAIVTCAETENWSDRGVPPGKCVDAALVNHLFGTSLKTDKDLHQRPACGCAPSRDIGMYDTCLFGCTYCYATSSFDRARRLFAAHDPEATALA